MNTKTAMLSAAVGGLLAIAHVVSQAQPAATPDYAAEKCYGVAKAGKNDCAANGHSCQAQSKQDANPREWLYVPKGTCDRIVGGSLTVR